MPVIVQIILGCFVLLTLGQAATKPAVLFSGFRNHCSYSFARKLVDDGFEVNTRPISLERQALRWEEVKSYNALVIAGLGHADADGTVSVRDRETIQTINQFIDEGGGVFFVPSWIQMDSLIPSQKELLKGWGVDAHFSEIVYDQDPAIKATPWKIPFIHTADIRTTFIMNRVPGLWLPVERRVGMQSHLVPFTVNEEWTIEAASPASTFTRTVPLDQQEYAGVDRGGVFTEGVPLLASRELRQGRAVVCAIRGQDWLWGTHAETTLQGVALDRGLGGKPSGGYRLVLNALRWLSKPSMDTGRLGGAQTAPSQIKNPHKPKPAKPHAWAPIEKIVVPRNEKSWPGVIGARSAFSGGQGSAADWVAKAKSLGMAYLVFLEKFDELDRDQFRELRDQCAKLSDDGFVALPGFRIDDEVGNHYFYAGPNLRYPSEEILSDDGKLLVSFDAQLLPHAPREKKGQLANSTLKYAYQECGFRLLAGNYLFHQDAAPLHDWFSNYQAAAVFTCEKGKVIDDSVEGYLEMIDSGQAPLPVVVELLERPEDLELTPWRTVVQTAKSDAKNPVAEVFGHWNFYPANPTRIFVSEGPPIVQWASVGPSDYEGRNAGNFVWQNQRWLLQGEARSEVGIHEVRVYDGTELFRRYDARGETTFRFTLDLNHSCQRNLVLKVIDRYGRRAISSELWSKSHRMQEVMCADRNNQLSYGHTIRDSDGTSLVLGGSGALSTPNKRVHDRRIRPSGVFKNDPYLGAAAFDGVTGNDPEVITEGILRFEGQDAVRGPRVGSSRRLLHSGDVNIGEGFSEYVFSDEVGTYNVWHSLWSAEKAKHFTITQRNTLFQVDPDSPLSVTQMEIEVRIVSDIPQATELEVLQVRPNEAEHWAVKSVDGRRWSGNPLEGQASLSEASSVAMGPGAWIAALGSPLGGTAVIPRSDGLTLRYSQRHPNQISLVLSGDNLPKKAGEVRRLTFLVLGIPRETKYTDHLNVRSAQVVAQFVSDFNLDGVEGGYEVEPLVGEVTQASYPLVMVGHLGAFSGRMIGDPVGSLPVILAGQNDHWSSYFYDRNLGKARPLGVFEDESYAALELSGGRDFFLGHPVTCNHPEVRLQLTQVSESGYRLEVHNPLEEDLKVELRRNHLFEPLAKFDLPEQNFELRGGTSVFFSLPSQKP